MPVLILFLMAYFIKRISFENVSIYMISRTTVSPNDNYNIYIGDDDQEGQGQIYLLLDNKGSIYYFVGPEKDRFIQQFCQTQKLQEKSLIRKKYFQIPQFLLVEVGSDKCTRSPSSRTLYVLEFDDVRAVLRI